MFTKQKISGILRASAIIFMIGFIGTQMATIFALDLPDYAAKEAKRVRVVESTFSQFMQEANREYCLPRQKDLEEKRDIKEALGEDTTDIQNSINFLSTNEGCELVVLQKLGKDQ